MYAAVQLREDASGDGLIGHVAEGRQIVSRGPRARHYLLASLLTLSIAAPCGAKVPPSSLSAADRARLEEPARLRLLDASQPLPPNVVDYCADANGRLALPGDRWEPTDVLSGGLLPRRRLVWAAQSEDLLVVHYEQGGFAHTYHVIVVQIEADQSTFKLLWRAAGPRLSDYPNFVRALKANDFYPEALFFR